MLRIIKCRDFFVVDESVQWGGSFKTRGTRCFVDLLRQRQTVTTSLITFSSGNQGIAVALLGRALGKPVTVVAPRWIEQDKLALMYNLGCNVVHGGESATDCEEVCVQMAHDSGAALLHPFRSRVQIMGYTSLWCELDSAFPDGVDVVVPVGSGGLLAAGLVYKALRRARYRIIGVEPSACASLAAALRCGRPELIRTRSQVAAALNVNIAPEEWLDLVSGGCECELVSVRDEVIENALVSARQEAMMLDPAAAAAIGWVLESGYRPRTGKLAVIVTGRGAGVSGQRLSDARMQQHRIWDRELQCGKRIATLQAHVMSRRPCLPAEIESMTLGAWRAERTNLFA